MKILVTAMDKNENGLMDARFGRALYWYIFDTNTKESYFIDNTRSENFEHGAGMQAVANVIDEGVDVIITGSVGPKAFNIIKTKGIKVYRGNPEKSVIENLNDYENNLLEEQIN
ncbi:NifB/NifX family molybdenum-iron cluster-binding protein [Deferribacterales bacterium Es71-Z0220]|uniref:NifB/NifX family molybdenum-iron cluster-binding protein n=1 Tax=Deferrivibrio essentukiensis TaxID=2880922 RepID=UPI001F621B75|nr:NifB/NifX family molybdenum-iron cluster-binding protein [Deferrivibrio essentukiensis]MCB4203551.1 NifB/NifX family molybdenum-iron cluster-binding protein [Deferrivibrio essentukiensis]